MTARTVLLTGASGFIGSAVRSLLRAHPEHGIRVRVLSRSPATGVPSASGAPSVTGVPSASGGEDRVHADLADPRTLHGAAADADVLVHLASLVSGDEAACTAVNVHGTRALMREAARAGVGRIVHLSTSAVYGRGPHRGIGVGEVAAAPVSPASRTRLAGEHAALDAGALVLRPHLVVGAGDRWVVPCLAELTRRVPGRWAGGDALLGMVAVTDLARLIVALACSADRLPGGVLHAGHPEPVPARALLDTLTEHAVLAPVPRRDWSWQQCLDQLARVPGAAGARQLELFAVDHWYRSEEVWRLAGTDPGPGPLARLAEAAPWYRSHLAGGPGPGPAG
ncbi:NAD-dependent epimerase/dehydratase family protein [Kitasatospora sp. NPDC008050]|uniref:NAD-dependent epimerase/dehydratase family protein n=1 Tax=Kitasatospora sp. NPDC008050 TaxID=3364021 RepID=UPI0036E8808F